MVSNDINIHIRNVQNGDLNSLRFIINQYKKMAMSIAIRILKNHDDAEDVVQESFLLAYQNIGKFNFSTKFSTWFYKIVLNKTLSVIRVSKPDFVSIDEVPEIDEYPDDTDDNFEYENLQNIIEKAFERLKDNEAVILRLYYYDDMKIDEIAKILDIGYSNAKIIIHRARLKLKHILLTEFKNDFGDRL